MTDIRSVPLFPGDIRAIKTVLREPPYLSWGDRNLLAQIIERYEEACTCPVPHNQWLHMPPCPKAAPTPPPKDREARS